MATIEIGDLLIGIDDSALACACAHDSCFVQQNNPEHYNDCGCPKVEGTVALSVSLVGDDSWDSIYWSHLSRTELAESIDTLRSQIRLLQQGRPC